MFSTALLVFLGGYSICVGAAYFASPSGVRFADAANPVKWVHFVEGVLMRRALEPHIIEQLFIRVNDIECRECVAAGKCKACGCKMPERAMSFNESCSKGNWGPIITDLEEYKQFREEVPVKIEISYEGV